MADECLMSMQQFSTIMTKDTMVTIFSKKDDLNMSQEFKAINLMKPNKITKVRFFSTRVDGVGLRTIDTTNQKLKPFVVDPTTTKPLKSLKRSTKDFEFTINNIYNYELNDNLINPNVIYKLRQDDSYAFDILKLFELESKNPEIED